MPVVFVRRIYGAEESEVVHAFISLKDGDARFCDLNHFIVRYNGDLYRQKISYLDKHRALVSIFGQCNHHITYGISKEVSCLTAKVKW